MLNYVYYLNENVLNYIYKDKQQVTTKEGKTYTLTKQNLGLLSLPSGRIVANDPCFFFQDDDFIVKVNPGNYPVSIYIAETPEDKRVALAMISFSNKIADKWEMALVEGQCTDDLGEDEFYGYSVDSGTGGFVDKNTADLITKLKLNTDDFLLEQLNKTYINTYSYAMGSINDSTKKDIAAFSSGWGDGAYPSYFGFDEHNEPCTLVTDFMVLD